MPYLCGHCKDDDDLAIAKKKQFVEREKLQQEYDMLERMIQENNRRKLELEKKMCPIPREHCQDCRDWDPDTETETELSRMKFEGEDQPFEGQDFVGTREAVFFLYAYFQQVSQAYLDMVNIDTDIQREEMAEEAKKEHQRRANGIFHDLRGRLTKFLTNFGGVVMSL